MGYRLDLRHFYGWFDKHHVELFEVTRTHIELYAQELEELGRAPPTIGRRLSTLTRLYRYASEDAMIEHSPALHVRRPRLDYGWHAIHFDRNDSAPAWPRQGSRPPATTRCAPCWR